MCGFIGRLNLDGERGPQRRVPLSQALLFLERRGPDSWQHWQSPDAGVELLHTRLAIVDQDDRARQPFTDPATSITVVFNGEIYNYEDLRRELADYPFRTTSDTEVLLATFTRWGASGLKRLRGMFACAGRSARTAITSHSGSRRQKAALLGALAGGNLVRVFRPGAGRDPWPTGVASAGAAGTVLGVILRSARQFPCGVLRASGAGCRHRIGL